MMNQITPYIIAALLTSTVVFGVSFFQMKSYSDELIELVQLQEEVIESQQAENRALYEGLKRSIQLTQRATNSLNQCIDELETRRDRLRRPYRNEQTKI